MSGSKTHSRNESIDRRSFLRIAGAGSTLLAVPGVASSQQQGPDPIDIGVRKQLFIDERFIQVKRNVTLSLVAPDLQRENLLVADKP